MDYSWVKVKKYEMDPSKAWKERYHELEQHHLEETEFLFAEIERLRARQGMKMNIIWAKQEPTYTRPGIFLAGPTLRTSNAYKRCPSCPPDVFGCKECSWIGHVKLSSWRKDACHALMELGYDGDVYVPEPEGFQPFVSLENDDEASYDAQVSWEQLCLTLARVIVFWVPREMKELPALTTNIEFGMWAKSGKCVIGYPSDAQKMRYFQYMSKKCSIPLHDDLRDTLATAVRKWKDEQEGHKA